jgi:pimeloyl-ACP methyl ester carboxylesterase
LGSAEGWQDAVTVCVIEDIVAGGRYLRVRRWPGEGRPLVLLHGLFDSSAGWEGLAAGTGRPCVAFDLPGFGGSQAPRRPLIDSYADDIVSGIERLGLETLTLVGHSLGGAIATSIAERCPAVDSLALLAPAGFGPIRLADLFALPGIHRVAMTALPFALMTPPVILGGYMAFVSNGRRPTRELVDRIRGDARPTANGARAAIRALHDCAHAPDAFHRRRVDFDGPVAAVWGSRDALVSPSHATGLRAALPQARVEVWSGMGHHPQHERAAELARFIERCAQHGDPQPNAVGPLGVHPAKHGKAA